MVRKRATHETAAPSGAIAEQYGYGLALNKQGRFAEAEPVFRGILEADAGNGPAAYMLGVCYLNLDQRFNARQTLLTAAALMPASPQPWELLAGIFQSEHAYGKAFDCFDKALRIAPDSLFALVNSGVLLVEARRHGEALQRFQRALKIDPTNAVALKNKKVVLDKLQQRSNYGWAAELICSDRQADFRVIFEVGSRDALDAIWLAKLFPAADVFAFEANPESAQVCRSNVEFAKLRNVTVVEHAASNQAGTITFYPFDPAKYDNVGASSMFKIEYTESRSPQDPDYGIANPQTEIEVAAIRVDDFCRERGIERIDMVCMDVQGAEVLALDGFGALLPSVAYIVSEASHRSTYVGGCNFRELNDFLERHGFRAVSAIPPDNGYYYDFNVTWENFAATSAGKE